MAPKLVSKITIAKRDSIHSFVTNAPKGGVGVVAYTTGKGKNKKTFQAAVDSIGKDDNSDFWAEAQKLLIKKLKEQNKI